MLADDLVRAVAFDPLRASIPGKNVPFRIELENGVVDDCIDELNKAVFTLYQAFPSLKTVGNVALTLA